MTLDSSNASIQSSIQLTTGTIPSNWFSVSDFQWKMWCSCRSLGNKFDLFLKNLFANYSVRTETKWRLLSIQLKIRDVPKWRNFLEKLLESSIIAEFPKCEPFNWKIPKFLVENWQMEIPVCVYLARFFLLLHSTTNFRKFKSEVLIKWKTPQTQCICSVREWARGWLLPSKANIGWHIINVSSTNLSSLYHACRSLFEYTLLAIYSVVDSEEPSSVHLLT